MSELKRFIDKFRNLKGAKFISINNYLSKESGELANHTINVNISVQEAKRKDFESLKSITDKDLKDIATASNIAVDVLKTSLAEMLVSAEKNLSEKLSDRTAQSQAQTCAYIDLAPGVKLHPETLAIHIFGMAIKKEILVKGEYKSVNSSPKTLGKSAITKHLDLRAGKFRNFILANADNLKVSGTPIEIDKSN
jgi:hypothetical protein